MEFPEEHRPKTRTEIERPSLMHAPYKHSTFMMRAIENICASSRLSVHCDKIVCKEELGLAEASTFIYEKLSGFFVKFQIVTVIIDKYNVFSRDYKPLMSAQARRFFFSPLNEFAIECSTCKKNQIILIRFSEKKS